MEDYLFIIISILIALLISLIIVGLKLITKNALSSNVDSILGWSVLIFSLVLSFSLISFYTRYVDLKISLETEITNYELIYEMLKNSEGSESAILSMEKYLKEFKNNRYDKSKNKMLYDNMNNEIFSYIKYNPNVFSNQILNKMSANSQTIIFVDEIKMNKFLVYVMLIMFIFIILTLFLVKLVNPLIQFIAYFCFLSIVCIIFAVSILFANPSLGNIVGLNFQNYINLYNKIISEKKHRKYL